MVRATSVANPAAYGSATITLMPNAGSMVQDLSITSLTLSSGTSTYQAHNSINAEGSVTLSGSATVLFQAGTSVRLGPGFHATAGTAPVTFHCNINPAIQ